MYEQISHSLLNEILDEVKPEIRHKDLRYFFTRLGANFYAIYSLFHHLYGHREDLKEQMVHLVEVLASRYIERTHASRKMDREREKDHNWFLSQEWVAMALYTDGFAKNLEGVHQKISYFQELGVNTLHLMPMMTCPKGASDGGYAVSNFRQIDPRLGTLDDLEALSKSLRARKMLLVLDVVVNHTSNEHDWAKKAKQGETKYQDYYFAFPDRQIPDMFEESMPEIFPETSPGNFTWDQDMEKWVMTVFNNYQWDLNYSNPTVLIEMIDVILYWANNGADIVRLDAVAFLWKKMGTTCQNQREAHLILQLMKDCCQVTAPGVLFIAEAIVAPSEIIKYFGEDAVIAKECEIAYNATFMALLWDAVATKNTQLLNQGICSLPIKLDRATWLNYVRSHDDIGLGFDDSDIQKAGFDPHSHRHFLVNYFTGVFEDSDARGQPFGQNLKTGDSRISGSLASLVGLEVALERKDSEAIDQSVNVILLLHNMILSFGGIPLLYYGDELGSLNDFSFKNDLDKASDNRWIHRPRIDWEKAKRRHQKNTVENRLFMGIKHLIDVRKTIPAFADFNNREVLEVENDHLFVFLRTHPERTSEVILVVANFDSKPQHLSLGDLRNRGQFQLGCVQDLVTGAQPTLLDDQLVVPPFKCFWLTDQIPK